MLTKEWDLAAAMAVRYEEGLEEGGMKAGMKSPRC